VNRFCVSAALMGLLLTAVTPVMSRTAWNRVKVLSGFGDVNGAVSGVDPSWTQLKFKWSSPCPSPRILAITARGEDADLASKRFADLGPVGEAAFPIPAGSTTVIAVMTNGPCEARSEVEVFATNTAAQEMELTYQAAPTPPTAAQVKQDKAAAKARAKVEKRRLANLSSQPAIIRACVTIYDIQSHPLGLFRPGLGATIQNNCPGAATVRLSIGYFRKNGVQFGDGVSIATVAPHTRYDMFHEASLFGNDRWLLSVAKILSVDVY
jgi:hypothetical protein